MIDTGISLDKLTQTFLNNGNPIHPAVLNRQTEINYLRGIAKFLIPRLFRSTLFESKIFFSLIRETITFWVLLPLLDELSDPNLINLLVVIATEPKHDKEITRKYKDMEKVHFLENFVNKSEKEKNFWKLEEILNDQTRLYAFMQFLIKENALEVLQFHLDVDRLNSDVYEPEVTTDPTKLSSLHQKSEELLEKYKKMIKNEVGAPEISTLTEAHEHVKDKLNQIWKRKFFKTRSYFEIQYGDRDFSESNDEKFVYFSFISYFNSYQI